MSESLEALLAWVRITFKVDIEPVDLYSPSERQRGIQSLRRIVSEILDVECPEAESYEDLTRFVCRTIGIPTSLENESCTAKGRLRVLLQLLLGCAVTSFQKSTEKKQSYVVQILEIDDTEDNVVKNQLKKEIEAFNKMVNAANPDDSFHHIEEALRPKHMDLRRQFKQREARFLEQIKDLEETVLDLKVQLDDTRSAVSLGETKDAQLTETLEIVQEHEQTIAQKEDIIVRLKSRVEQLNASVSVLKQEEQATEGGLRKSLQDALGIEQKLREHNIKLAAMLEENRRENDLLSSQLDNATAKSLQLEQELSTLQFETKELHSQVNVLQNQACGQSPVKGAAIEDELFEANQKELCNGEAQCDIITYDTFVLQKLRTQELAQLNNKLSNQIFSLEEEITELKRTHEIEKTKSCEKEKALCEEMKEWEEYAQKLESDSERLQASNKDLKQAKDELGREAEFWTKKTEESHGQFSELAKQVQLLEGRHSDRELAIAEDRDAWRIKYYLRKSLFDSKYGKLLSKAKAHRETEVHSRKQMKKLLAIKDHEVSKIKRQLDAAVQDLHQSKIKRLAIKAAQCFSIKAEINKAVNEQLAEYVDREGGEISNLIGALSDRAEGKGHDVLSVLVATPTEIDQKLSQEQRAMQEKIERMTREIEWLREQQRHAHLQNSGDSSLFHVKQEEPEHNVSHLTALVAQLEVEKRAISAAKYAEIEKRIEAQNRIKYLEIENDKLKLRNTHQTRASGNSQTVSDNWFTIAPVSKSVIHSPARPQVTTEPRSCSVDGRRRPGLRSASKQALSPLTPPSESEKENCDSNASSVASSISSSKTKTFRIRYSGDNSVQPLRSSR